MIKIYFLAPAIFFPKGCQKIHDILIKYIGIYIILYICIPLYDTPDGIKIISAGEPGIKITTMKSIIYLIEKFVR